MWSEKVDGARQFADVHRHDAESDLARSLPNSDLIIYSDAGHGGVFQFQADFVPKALEFLAR